MATSTGRPASERAARAARRGTLLLVLAVAACRSGAGERLERFEFERPQMGTLFRVVLYAQDRRAADAASAAAWARLDELNARLSDFDPDSELSRLSSASAETAPTPWIGVSADLAAVLARARDVSEGSDGAFDVTCGQATRLWRRAIREGELPAAEALERARETIDFRAVELSADHSKARLLRPGMRLDLGGIAKGYALDEMLRAIAAEGVSSALVVGGGDIVAGEAPPDRAGWRIELDPGTEAPLSARRALELRRAAVATSGDLYRSAEIDGRRRSHIVDPRTGASLTTRCGATVIAADGMTADALATAAVVLGPDGCARLWRSFEDCAFRVVAGGRSGFAERESPSFARLVVH